MEGGCSIIGTSSALKESNNKSWCSVETCLSMNKCLNVTIWKRGSQNCLHQPSNSKVCSLYHFNNGSRSTLAILKQVRIMPGLTVVGMMLQFLHSATFLLSCDIYATNEKSCSQAGPRRVVPHNFGCHGQELWSMPGGGCHHPPLKFKVKSAIVALAIVKAK